VHPQRSVITRALGTEAEVDVDAFSIPAQPGDVFMLCSDGLTSMIADEQILELVGKARNLKAAAKALVDAANRGGGEDNITVVLFEIAQDGETTASMPAVQLPGQGRDGSDETTLSELEAVPVVEAPPPERAPRRRRPTHRLALVLAGTGAVVVALAAGGVFALSRAHFVGGEANGHVAVYQGVPWDLGAGVHLYRLRYESPLLVEQLSRHERQRLFDHDLHSYATALGEVRGYEEDATP
jgi:protein phosphatase